MATTMGAYARMSRVRAQNCARIGESISESQRSSIEGVREYGQDA